MRYQGNLTFWRSRNWGCFGVTFHYLAASVYSSVTRGLSELAEQMWGGSVSHQTLSRLMR